MHKPFRYVSASLLASAILGVPMFVAPTEARAEVTAVQQQGVVKGTVKDTNGEAAIGASVIVVGTKNVTTTDVNGNFTLKNVPQGATVRVSLIGYEPQSVKWTGGPLNIVVKSADNSLNEVVVTAMGIARKEKSLTYATQQIKNDEFMKVQDPNVVNSIEGKVSGVTITAGAGGAGGASKILLRGNKSILGNNAPADCGRRYPHDQQHPRTGERSRPADQRQHQRRFRPALHDQPRRHRVHEHPERCQRRRALRFGCRQRCGHDYHKER